MERNRIFMCCHKQYSIIPPLCEPVLCGADLNASVDGTLPDNTGDNISRRNREYSELTAHYHAWKNIEAEYYGFCHYRRFFCVDESIKRPYITTGELSGRKQERLLGSEEQWNRLISEHDIIVTRSEDMGLAAREHYITSAYHYAEDLDLFLDILAEKAPHLKNTADEYLSQNRQYFCNMFIMKAEYFKEYCGILFPVLEEFDKAKKLHGDYQSDRTDGYLGEIFTGIYITYCRKNGAVIKELPRIDHACTFKKRLGCAVLPPESKRRFIVKKLVKKMRG